jgi:hypothetical protein
LGYKNRTYSKQPFNNKPSTFASMELLEAREKVRRVENRYRSGFSYRFQPWHSLHDGNDAGHVEQDGSGDSEIAEAMDGSHTNLSDVEAN